MPESFKYLTILIAGAGLGALLQLGYFYSETFYSETENVANNHLLLEKVLQHAAVHISDTNDACEGASAKTVGAVVASLIEFNVRQQKNRMTYGCVGEVCSVYYSDCSFWQQSECSSRFLKFQIKPAGIIDTSSFSCLDLP